jgi:uncharacterized protein involved in exopolysaccharide biosynthesis
VHLRGPDLRVWTVQGKGNISRPDKPWIPEGFRSSRTSISDPISGPDKAPAIVQDFFFYFFGPMTHPHLESDAEEGLDLRRVAARFWAFKWLFLIVLIVSLGIGYGVAKMSPRIYESTSKFLTKSGEAQQGNLSDLMALAGVRSKAGSSSDPGTYIEEIVLGDDLLREIIKRPWPHNGDTVRLQDVWKMVPDKTNPDWEYVFERQQIGNLRGKKRIKVEKSKTNSLIVLTTEFESPELAMAINRYILDFVNDYTVNKLVTQARQNRKFIEERIGEALADLEKSENAMKVFRLRNLSLTSPELQVEFARLTRNQKIHEEIYLEMRKQGELAKIEEYKHQPVVEVILSPAKAIYPSRPDKKLIMAGSGGIGLFVALFLSYLFYGIRRVWRRA